MSASLPKRIYREWKEWWTWHQQFKQIKVFKLYKNKYYGYLTIDDRQKYWALFKALTKEEILNVDESNYNNVTALKDHLTLDDYKIIYASIKIK